MIIILWYCPSTLLLLKYVACLLSSSAAIVLGHLSSVGILSLKCIINRRKTRHHSPPTQRGEQSKINKLPCPRWSNKFYSRYKKDERRTPPSTERHNPYPSLGMFFDLPRIVLSVLLLLLVLHKTLMVKGTTHLPRRIRELSIHRHIVEVVVPTLHGMDGWLPTHAHVLLRWFPHYHSISYNVHHSINNA